MGDQINHVDAPKNAKNQVIFVKNHPLSLIIIQYIHEENFHKGREYALHISDNSTGYLCAKN